MYIPKDFEVNDLEQINSFMQANNFATLVSWNGGRLSASHLLFEVVTGDPSGTHPELPPRASKQPVAQL